MMRAPDLSCWRDNLTYVRRKWGVVTGVNRRRLQRLSEEFGFCALLGDLLLLGDNWYVTHTGLIRLANRKRCFGIQIRAVSRFCDVKAAKWAFRATVFKSRTCKGFVGYGDADPSNVSDLVRGAEMRVAETRAVNRALRKAYGIGICSVEEIGSFSGPVGTGKPPKKTAQPANGDAGNSQPLLRDRLCQLIRQHELDPILVKSYALEFCRVKTLKDATREQIENFIHHLRDWVQKDKNALLCQLNSYLPPKEGAA